MKPHVLVQVWCEIDPTLNVRVDRHTGEAMADPPDRLRRVTPLGRVGVHAGLRLGGTVTAFALGGGHRDALHHALAAGADRAIELLAAGDDPEALALAPLADWIQRQQPDLVIADRLAGFLAGQLGWAHLAGLDDLQISGGLLRAVRFLERGDREWVTAKLPAAVRLQSESVRPPYVSRARFQAVGDERIERESLPATEAAATEVGSLQQTRPRTRLGKVPAAPAASASDRLQALLGLGKPASLATQVNEKTVATPEQMAEEFVRYLAHHQLGELPSG